MPIPYSSTDSDKTMDALKKMNVVNCLRKEFNVYELSEKQTVLLLFLRHFGCNICYEAVSMISLQYLDLIKANVVPIFVHQESQKQGNYYFENFPSPMTKYILHCNDSNNTFSKAFGIKDQMPLLPLLNIKHIILYQKAAPTNHFKLSNLHTQKDDQSITIQKRRLPATFVIQKGHIIKEYKVNNIFVNRPDYLKLVTIDIDTECVTQQEDNAWECDSNVCFKKVGPTHLKKSELLQVNQQDSSPHVPVLVKQALSKEGITKSSTSSTCFTVKEDSIEWKSIDLLSVLQHDKARKYLKYYFSKEHSVENILFYELVTYQYKPCQSDTVRHTLATKMMETFFSTDSAMELNVSDRQRKHICKQIETNSILEANLFDRLLEELQGEVMEDTFLRFKETKEYRTMLRLYF